MYSFIPNFSSQSPFLDMELYSHTPQNMIQYTIHSLHDQNTNQFRNHIPSLFLPLQIFSPYSTHNKIQHIPTFPHPSIITPPRIYPSYISHNPHSSILPRTPKWEYFALDQFPSPDRVTADFKIPGSQIFVPVMVCCALAELLERGAGNGCWRRREEV